MTMTNLLLLGFLPSGSEWIIIALVILLVLCAYDHDQNREWPKSLAYSGALSLTLMLAAGYPLEAYHAGVLNTVKLDDSLVLQEESLSIWFFSLALFFIVDRCGLHERLFGETVVFRP